MEENNEVKKKNPSKIGTITYVAAGGLVIATVALVLSIIGVAKGSALVKPGKNSITEKEVTEYISLITDYGTNYSGYARYESVKPISFHATEDYECVYPETFTLTNEQGETEEVVCDFVGKEFTEVNWTINVFDGYKAFSFKRYYRSTEETHTVNSETGKLEPVTNVEERWSVTIFTMKDGKYYASEYKKTKAPEQEAEVYKYFVEYSEERYYIEDLSNYCLTYVQAALNDGYAPQLLTQAPFLLNDVSKNGDHMAATIEFKAAVYLDELKKFDMYSENIVLEYEGDKYVKGVSNSHEGYGDCIRTTRIAEEFTYDSTAMEPFTIDGYTQTSSVSYLNSVNIWQRLD